VPGRENSGCVEISRIQSRAAMPQTSPRPAPPKTAGHTDEYGAVASRGIANNQNPFRSLVLNALGVSIFTSSSGNALPDEWALKTVVKTTHFVFI